METSLIISDCSKLIWKKLESEFKILKGGVRYTDVNGTREYLYTELSVRNEDEFFKKLTLKMAKNQWTLNNITLYPKGSVQFLFVGYNDKLNETYVFEVTARTRREVIKLIAEELRIESYRDKEYSNWKQIFIEAGIYRHELGKVL